MSVLKQQYVFEEMSSHLHEPILGHQGALSYVDGGDVLVLGQDALESNAAKSDDTPYDIELESSSLEEIPTDSFDLPQDETQKSAVQTVSKDILERVRQQAYTQGQKDAKAGFAQQLDQAYKKGLSQSASQEDRSELLEQSFEDGVAQGKEDAKRLVAEKCDEILAQIDQFVQDKNQLLADAKKPMVDFSIAMADRLVQTRIETDQSLVLALVDEGIQKLLESDKVLIKVNRDHIEFFKANQQYFHDRLPHIKTILFQEDNALSDGCVFETDLGFVDSTLSIKVEYLRDAMHHNDLHK